jgi:hypothetical protein
MELMLVSELMVSSTQLTNSLVVLIHDSGVTMSMTISSIVVTLETEEHILALPLCSLEVGCPDGIYAVARPD